MDRLIKLNYHLNRFLILLGGIAVVALTTLAAANMLLRMFLTPINGSYELISFCGAVAIAFALGYTQIKKNHIIVNIFTDKFSKKANSILDGINYFVNMLFFGLVAWETLKWGMKIARTGEVSETLKIVYHPFVYCVAFGFGVLALTLCIDFIILFHKKEGT
jgi:TRAP-type C4-dicarboxylate transport system permease small subunit